MQIQIHRDNHIKSNPEQSRDFESVLKGTLDRFADRITRIEMHLSDQNGQQKSGADDKKCVLEARLAGLQPITTTAQSSTIELAVHSAADKLEKAIAHWLDRLDDSKGRTSFAGETP